MAQPSNPDLRLVQKAIKGNRKAFTSLFDRYFQSVYNFALMLSRNPAMAEDLTQEAFIRAHANLERLGPPWNFRAWIFRLTRNYFIDLTRKERKVDPLEEGEPVISPGPGPEKEIMSRETADRVHNTLNKLGVRHREILVLRELNEFSYAEIGEILNLSLSNVKVSLHRARAAFQESYGIRLLLEDPTGDCKEVTALLHAFHDNEELLDKEKFVKEHLKTCPECRERREMLITQSVALGAIIPVIPPRDLAQRILKQTASSTGGGSAPKTSPLQKILGYGGGAAVLGLMAWFVFTLVFNTQKILPNFPRSGDLEPSPEVLAPPAPIDTAVPPPPPPPPPTDTAVPPPPPPPPEGPSDTGSSSERCNRFDGLEISLVLLNIREDTGSLPLYLKMEGGIPGVGLEIPDDPEPWEYNALLGSIESNHCSLQGFDDRLYCLFTIPSTAPGTAQDLSLFLNGCADPVIFMSGISIPELTSSDQEPLVCSKDLLKGSCESAGGIYRQPKVNPSFCECP